MTYTLHIQAGTVTRDADGLQVAPCQSADEPGYVAYTDWCAAGNHPAVIDDPDWLPPPEPLSPEEKSTLRAEAFRTESDPLFFQEQRGEVPAGTWLAKVDEIRNRYP